MKKLAVLVFFALFITASFLSIQFALTNANHNHENTGHENLCHVCIIIHSVNNFLKQLFTSVKICLPSIGCMFGLFLLLKAKAIYFEHYSLITLKVRIDN